MVGRNFAMVCVLSILGACSESPTSRATDSGAVSPPKISEPTHQVGVEGNAQQPEVAATKWTYHEDKDEMRGVTAKYADLESDDTVVLGAPYEPGSEELRLRKDHHGLNIILKVNGQFVCSEIGSEHVSVKFDNKRVERYSCSEPSDGSPGVIFINGEKRFLSELRKSHRAIIEAPYYERGEQQVKFTTAGLKW